MELFLQFGHGMKKLSVDLSKKWGGLTTILSPRDMNPIQMQRWCDEFHKNNISCIFDPQCYFPKSEQKNLVQYDYWDKNLQTNIVHTNNAYTYEENVIRKLKHYNDIAKTVAFICPSIMKPFTPTWKDEWVTGTEKLIVAANRIVTDKEIWATIALPSGFLSQNEDEIEDLIQKITKWKVDGYYIIAETPERKYLVDNPLWLNNIMQLCAALKLEKKKVIYGYGNHQMLLLSMLKVDAIASGTWLNVRSFTNRFVDNDEQKRRSTWIYYPQALSEYKMSFIDLAYSTGVLQNLQLSEEFMNEYGEKIFRTEALPSSTGLSETIAFKFYLCSLKRQIENLNHLTYKDTYSANEVLLNTVQRTIEFLESKGIYAQTRSFSEIIDVNRSAMQILNNSRGFALDMSWDQL